MSARPRKAGLGCSPTRPARPGPTTIPIFWAGCCASSWPGRRPPRNAPSKQQFARAGELDGPLSDEVTPDPIVMANDADGIEVRAIAQGVAICDHHDVVMICDRRPHGCIDAEIGCPSFDQKAIWRDLFQSCLQVGPGERIV